MKMNNKGFSMVELIIVIAIMAILVGAIAPTLIKYVNKSRKSADASNAQTLATNMQSAAADQTAADGISADTVTCKILNGSIPANGWTGLKSSGTAFQDEFFSIAGANGKLAKVKYTKDGAAGFLITMDVAKTTTGNTVKVEAIKSDGTVLVELYPDNAYASN